MPSAAPSGLPGHSPIPVRPARASRSRRRPRSAAAIRARAEQAALAEQILQARPARPRTARTRAGIAGLTALTTAGALASVIAPAPALAGGELATAAISTQAAVSFRTAAPAARKARKPNPPTPGNFTGHGFDQCLTPTQSDMNAWLDRSPFLAVGVYISGDSRACRDQPNLTPQWVRTQLAKGWRLLPIILGPQASCQPRFPRYDDDFTISPARGNGSYPRARQMGRDSATESIADARRLGLVRGSTLYYDLEAFDLSNTDCRESALAFVSAWVRVVGEAGFKTGVYSSASSGIKMLDDARVNRRGQFNLPDQIWLARWDGEANLHSDYIRNGGWRPGGRIKQYIGGHDETWGGVRINIDSNYLSLGRGSVADKENWCGTGVAVSFPDYERLVPIYADEVASKDQVRALQCLLTVRGVYDGKLHGVYGKNTVAAAARWKRQVGRSASEPWRIGDWMNLLSFGRQPVLKVGSYGPYVRRVQRAVNAADIAPSLPALGSYNGKTRQLVTTYQRQVGLPTTGIVDAATWRALQSAKRSR